MGYLDYLSQSDRDWMEEERRKREEAAQANFQTSSLYEPSYAPEPVSLPPYEPWSAPSETGGYSGGVMGAEVEGPPEPFVSRAILDRNRYGAFDIPQVQPFEAQGVQEYYGAPQDVFRPRNPIPLSPMQLENQQALAGGPMGDYLTGMGIEQGPGSSLLQPYDGPMTGGVPISDEERRFYELGLDPIIPENMQVRPIIDLNEATAFAESVSNRDKYANIIPDAVAERIPGGEFLQDVTRIGPDTLFLAPLTGPSTFAARGLLKDPIARGMAGTIAAATSADIVPAAAALTRAGARGVGRLASVVDEAVQEQGGYRELGRRFVTEETGGSRLGGEDVPDTMGFSSFEFEGKPVIRAKLTDSDLQKITDAATGKQKDAIRHAAQNRWLRTYEKVVAEETGSYPGHSVVSFIDSANGEKLGARELRALAKRHVEQGFYGEGATPIKETRVLGAPESAIPEPVATSRAIPPAPERYDLPESGGNVGTYRDIPAPADLPQAAANRARQVDEFMDATPVGPKPEAFVSEHLSRQGSGNPGIETHVFPADPETGMGKRVEITYRSADGNPIGYLEAIETKRGLVAETLVADPRAGLAKGRAVKALIDEAQRQGVVGVGGTVTPDAQRLMRRLESGTIAAKEAADASPRGVAQDSFVGADDAGLGGAGVSNAGIRSGEPVRLSNRAGGASDSSRGGVQKLAGREAGVRGEGSESAAPVRQARKASSLETVADDAEAAAKAGEDLPPPKRPTTEGTEPPGARGKPGRFARPSTLKTVEEITDDVRRSTQNWVGATTRTAGKLPPLRSALEAINPSAFIEDPPDALVKELGGKGKAKRFLASLNAYNRKTEHAGALRSAIEDGVKQRARAVGLSVKKGILRSKDVDLGPVGDVFENPSKYRRYLTDDQRQFIDDVDAILDDMNQAEKRAGVKKGEVYSEEGRYFPRRVIEVDGIESVRGAIRQNVGAKQGFQKGRFYETMAEAMENGVKYDGDVSALIATRVHAGMKAIGDKEIEDILSAFGRVPTEAEPVKFGEMGTTVAGLGPRVFPQSSAVKIMEELTAKGAPGGPLSVARVANAILVPLRATGDLSYSLMQGLTSAGRNPAGWLKSVGYSLDGLFLDGRLYGRYIQGNARWVERYARAGGILRGTEVTFEGASQGHWMRRLFAPAKFLTSRFDSAFTNGGNVQALELFKGMVGVGDNVGADKMRQAMSRVLGNLSGETSDEVAASIASKATGRLSTRSLGISQSQQQAEAILAFAPKFYRAVFGLLGDAVQGGMRGAESRRTLLQLMAGAGVAYATTAHILGQEPNWDPRNSKFLTLKVNGQHVGFGGPLYGLMRTVAEGVENPDRLAKLNKSNPVVRWGKGRLSPVVGIVVDLISQKDYLGKPLKTPEQIAEYLGLGALPFTAQTAIKEGLGAALATGSGLRSYPVPPAEKRNELAQAKFGKDYLKLDVDQRQQIDKSPEVKDLSAEIDKSQRERGDTYQQAQDQVNANRATVRAEQEADDAALESGKMEVDDWRKQSDLRAKGMAEYSRATYEARGVKFEERDREGQPIRAALDRYYGVKYEDYVNPDTRKLDYERYNTAREAAFEGLTPEQRQAAQAEIEKNLTPMQKQEKAAGKLLDQRPAHYSGLDKAGADQVDAFLREVSETTAQLEKQMSRDLKEANVARALAEQRGEPVLFQWWEALQSSKRREAITNPEYNEFFLKNREELEIFFPWYYDTADLKRMGVIAERDTGLQRLPKLTPIREPLPKLKTLREQQIDEAETADIRELVGSR